jgi:parallel beta-helix repeat protein
VSGGVLYINVGSAANPSTQSVTYAYVLCSYLTIEDCESWGNYSDTRIAGSEGHGYAFDDWADNSIFRRNKSHDNEGYGFSINKGSANQLVGNLAYNNGGPGVLINAADRATIINNTFINNNQIPFHARTGEVFASYGSSNGVVTNNILKGSVTYGIANDPGNMGFSGSNNNINGFITADRTNFTAGIVTVDPVLDVNYRPTSATVRRAGVANSGKDFYGKPFYSPPNIGAVDDVTSTPRYALRNRKY